MSHHNDNPNRSNSADLLNICSEIRRVAKSHKLHSAKSELNEIEQKLKDQTVYIVILGLFKRGKSSIINALLDADLAPVAVTPLTSIITLFKYGETGKAMVIFEDSSSNWVEITEIAGFVSEDLNPENKKAVKQVDGYYPAEFLKNLVLVDTPGLGSLYEHNSKTTTSFIPKIDAALYVLSADLPISAADASFLKDISKRVPKLFFLLNKKDLIDGDSLEKLKEFNIKNILKETKIDQSELNFLCISARQFLESNENEEREQSGIYDLKKVILNLSTESGKELISASSAGRLRQVLTQMEQLLKLSHAAFHSPIKDLEEQSSKLNQSLEIIQSSQEDFFPVIKNRNKLIMEKVTATVNQKTGQFKSQYRDILNSSKGLDIYINSPELFLEELNQDMKDFFNGMHGQIELDVKNRFNQIMLSFINQSLHFLNELSTQLEHQFGTKIDMVLGKFDLEAYSPFYLGNIAEHKISTPKSNPLLYFLPQKALYRRFTKTVLTELDRAVLANSSAMLYDISYRMEESLRKITFDLNLRTKETVDELLNVLSESKEERLKKEGDIKEAIERINEDLKLLETLKVKL